MLELIKLGRFYLLVLPSFIFSAIISATFIFYF